MKDTTESKIEEFAVELKTKYDGLVIKTDKDFEAMQALGKTAKAGAKKIVDHMKPQIDEANAKHKKLTALRKKLEAPYKEIADGAKRKCIEYTQAKQREAEEAARKVEEARLEKAKELEAAGDEAAAQAVIDAPTPEPVVAVPKVEGARRTWYASIVDYKAMFAAMANDGVPYPYDLDLDALAKVLGLGALARAQHDKVPIAGVEFKERTT